MEEPEDAGAQSPCSPAFLIIRTLEAGDHPNFESRWILSLPGGFQRQKIHGFKVYAFIFLFLFDKQILNFGIKCIYKM